MAKIWAISTNKGGVLKTSITTNLAGVMSRDNKKVLIIDTDNQSDCLLSFGQNPDTIKTTLYDVLVNGVAAEKAVMKVHKNIDLLPANDEMTFFEFDVLTNAKKYPNPFMLLKNALQAITAKYDYILIDTPPNLGLTQGNALCFANSVLIPFQPENYSMRALVKIIKAIGDFKEKSNPGLSILGVVATLVDQRTVLHSEVLQEAKRYCHENKITMFDSFIPRSVRFASSVAYERLPATLTADVKNPVVARYFELYKEAKQVE